MVVAQRSMVQSHKYRLSVQRNLLKSLTIVVVQLLDCIVAKASLGQFITISSADFMFVWAKTARSAMHIHSVL